MLFFDLKDLTGLDFSVGKLQPQSGSCPKWAKKP